MVLQCNDCSLWFRTTDKFENHKQGSLGLFCEGATKSSESDKNKKETESPRVIEEDSISDDGLGNSMKPTVETNKFNKDDDISDDDSSDVMTEKEEVMESDDFIISDDEENDNSKKELTTQTAVNKVTEHQPIIQSHGDSSKMKKPLSLEEALEPKFINKETSRPSVLSPTTRRPSSPSVSQPLSTESNDSSPKTSLTTQTPDKTSLSSNPKNITPNTFDSKQSSPITEDHQSQLENFSAPDFPTNGAKKLRSLLRALPSPRSPTATQTPEKILLGTEKKDVSPKTLSPARSSISMSKPSTPTTSSLASNSLTCFKLTHLLQAHQQETPIEIRTPEKTSFSKKEKNMSPHQHEIPLATHNTEQTSLRTKQKYMSPKKNVLSQNSSLSLSKPSTSPTSNSPKTHQQVTPLATQTPEKTSLWTKQKDMSPKTAVLLQNRPYLSLSKPSTSTTSPPTSNSPKTHQQGTFIATQNAEKTSLGAKQTDMPPKTDGLSPTSSLASTETHPQETPATSSDVASKTSDISLSKHVEEPVNETDTARQKSPVNYVNEMGTSFTYKTKNLTEKDDSIMLSDDDKSDEEGDYSKTSKKSDFTLISVHLDKFSVSSETSYTISQLGASTALSGGRETTFFRPIKPHNLEHYLENYKMEGDLLKALHITESEKGKFEFRAQFEIKRKEKNKIYCSAEEEALKGIREFIRKFENVILFGIDKDTIECLMTKIDFEEDNPVKGYMTWSSVLKHSTNYLGKKSYDSDLDLEDFYSEHCGKIAGYINTLDVATFLEKSIKKLFNDYAKKLSLNSTDESYNWHEIFQKIVEKMDNLQKPKEHTAVSSSQSNISVEVYSSFRPSVSTKIGLEKMETLQLSSGPDKSDSEIDVLEEKVTQRQKQSKDMLRQKLKKQFDLLKMRQKLQNLQRDKRRMQASVRYQPPQKKRRTQMTLRKPPSSTAIVISSGEDSSEESEGTDEEWVDHRRVVTDLKQRNPSLNVIPVSVPMPPVTPLSDHAPVTNTMHWPHCTLCNLEFAGLDALKTHIDNIHLRCSLCNLQFSVLEVATAHKKVHEDNTEAFKTAAELCTTVLNENSDTSSCENLLQEDTDLLGPALDLD